MWLTIAVSYLRICNTVLTSIFGCKCKIYARVGLTQLKASVGWIGLDLKIVSWVGLYYFFKLTHAQFWMGPLQKIGPLVSALHCQGYRN